MLDLTMKITADASQAKRELASVENGINRVEQAARKGEPSVAAVAKELGVYNNVTTQVIQSSAKMEQAAAQTTAQWLEQQYALNAVSKAQAIANAEMKMAAEGQQAVAAATGLSAVALTGLTAVIGAFLAVGALELKFLYDSAKLYAERSGLLKNFTEAIDDVKYSWQSMQMAVGAVLLSNVHDIDGWAGLAKLAIGSMADFVVGKITETMAAINLLSTVLQRISGSSTLQTVLGALPGGAGLVSAANMLAGATSAEATGRSVGISHPQPGFITGPYFSQSGGGYKNPFGFGPDTSTTGAGPTVLSGALAKQQAEDAVKRQRDYEKYLKNRQQAAEAIARFQSSYQTTGIYGSLPGVQMGMPVAPAAVPYLGYQDLQQMPGYAQLMPNARAMKPAGGYRFDYGGALKAPFTRDYFGFGEDTNYGGKMGSVANAAMGAYDLFQGALGIWQSTGQGNAGTRALSGGMQGMEAGAMFGPMGALIGGAGGALTGLLRGIFGETQGHKDLMAANAQIGGIKTDLLSQFGSKENIAALGGGNVVAGWGSQNVKGLQAFSGEVDKFKAHANDAMNDMIHAALTAGTAIPAGMRPILESLIRQGQLTQANTNLLLGMPEAGVPSFQQVSKAAEELGVNLDAIGKNIQNMKLGETAEAAAQAFQTLKDAGADMGAVFEQSAPKIQQIVNDALKMGLSLPESIKPWLQQMVDAGLLVDETGQKLSDLSKFSFTKPLEQSVDDLIKKLDELIDTIKTGLGGAIDSIDGKHVDVTVNRHVKDDPGSDAETGDNPPGYAHGTNGYEYFGSGKTVRLHGWEKVTPLTGGRSSERVAVPVQLQVDGRVFAEVMARTYLSG